MTAPAMINLLRRNKELLSYSFLTYVDKGLTFLLPLSVLYLFDDIGTYNRIEYIYSLATIILVVVELGIRGYYFYAYRNSNDRAGLLQNVQSYFDALLCIYIVASLPLLALGVWYNQALVAAMISSRVLYLMLTGFLSYHNRLNDKPFEIFYISLGLNIFCYLFFLGLYLLQQRFEVQYFFLPQLAVAVFYIFSRRRHIIPLMSGRLWQYIKEALRFYWPTMLNLLIVQSVANFGKVYAFRYLDAAAMAEISFVLRITLLVQLAHGACLEFLSKSLFTTDDRLMHRSILRKYSVMMGANIVGCVLLIFLSNLTTHITNFPRLSASSILFLMYVVLWCYGAYFESYFNKHGRNGLLLAIAAAATAAFAGFLLLTPSLNMVAIGAAMILYAAFYFALQLFYLKKHRLLTL